MLNCGKEKREEEISGCCPLLELLPLPQGAGLLLSLLLLQTELRQGRWRRLAQGLEERTAVGVLCRGVRQWWLLLLVSRTRCC